VTPAVLKHIEKTMATGCRFNSLQHEEIETVARAIDRGEDALGETFAKPATIDCKHIRGRSALPRQCQL
jgi:hypothetical protein